MAQYIMGLQEMDPNSPESPPPDDAEGADYPDDYCGDVGWESKDSVVDCKTVDCTAPDEGLKCPGTLMYHLLYSWDPATECKRHEVQAGAPCKKRVRQSHPMLKSLPLCVCVCVCLALSLSLSLGFSSTRRPFGICMPFFPSCIQSDGWSFVHELHRYTNPDDRDSSRRHCFNYCCASQDNDDGPRRCRPSSR